MQVLSKLVKACMLSANLRIIIFLTAMQIGNVSAAYINLLITFFKSIRHDPLEINVEESGLQKISLPYPDYFTEPFSHTAIHLDCTCGLVVELLNGPN